LDLQAGRLTVGGVAVSGISHLRKGLPKLKISQF
jgi:hypothetical protein